MGPKRNSRNCSNSNATWNQSGVDREWIPPSTLRICRDVKDRNTSRTRRQLIDKQRRRFAWIKRRFELHTSGRIRLNKAEKERFLDELESLFPILDVGDNSEVVTLRKKIEELDVNTMPNKPAKNRTPRNTVVLEKSPVNLSVLNQNEIKPKSSDNSCIKKQYTHSTDMFSDCYTPQQNSETNQSSERIELKESSQAHENFCHRLDVKEDIRLFQNLERLHEAQPLFINAETSPIIDSISQFDVCLLTNQNFVTNQRSEANISQFDVDLFTNQRSQANILEDEMLSVCDSMEVCSIVDSVINKEYLEKEKDEVFKGPNRFENVLERPNNNNKFEVPDNNKSFHSNRKVVNEKFLDNEVQGLTKENDESSVNMFANNHVNLVSEEFVRKENAMIGKTTTEIFPNIFENDHTYLDLDEKVTENATEAIHLETSIMSGRELDEKLIEEENATEITSQIFSNKFGHNHTRLKLDSEVSEKENAVIQSATTKIRKENKFINHKNYTQKKQSNFNNLLRCTNSSRETKGRNVQQISTISKNDKTTNTIHSATSDLFYSENHFDVFKLKTNKNCWKRRKPFFDFNKRFGSEKSMIVIEEVDSDDVYSEGVNNNNSGTLFKSIENIPQSEIFISDYEKPIRDEYTSKQAINNEEVHHLIAPNQLLDGETVNSEVKESIGNLKINEAYLNPDLSLASEETIKQINVFEKVQEKYINSKNKRSADEMDVEIEDSNTSKTDVDVSEASFDFLADTPSKIKPSITPMSEEERSKLEEQIDAKISKVEASGVLDGTFLEVLNEVNKCAKDAALRMIECLNKLDENKSVEVKKPVKEEINPFFFDADTMVLPEEEPETPVVLITDEEQEDELRQIGYNALLYQESLNRVVVKEEVDRDGEIPDWRELFPNYR